MKNIIIITGASSGLGKEFARQLDKKCPSNIDEIWLIARRTQLLQETAAKLSHNSRILTFDLTDKTDFAKISYLLKNEQPCIRILVNAAGFGLMGKFTELNIERQIEMVDLNCKSLVKLTHLCLPYMKKNSRIINIASSAAFAPQPNFSVYAASKAFVNSFNHALNREMHNRNIYVTSVCPGPVDTEFFDIACNDDNYPLWKKIFIADAKNVVNKAIIDSINKRSTSVYGCSMKAWQIISNCIPSDLLMRFFK